MVKRERCPFRNEIRNPKSEIRNKWDKSKKAKKTNKRPSPFAHFPFRPFELVSGFEIRISDLPSVMSITYLEAIREAQARALADDPRVFIYGQDVGSFGGAFKATKGLAKEFPDYGFEVHKGYATIYHREMLEEVGPCREHRRTFRGVLIEELDASVDADAEQLWIDEAQRRYDAYLKGELETIPGDDVMKRARSRVAAKCL